MSIRRVDVKIFEDKCTVHFGRLTKRGQSRSVVIRGLRKNDPDRARILTEIEAHDAALRAQGR